MPDNTAHAVLSPEGFKGHGCAICSQVIPTDDLTQLPIVILNGGKILRLWMHRACLAGVVPPRIAKSIMDLPQTTIDEIFATKVRLESK